MLSGCAAAKFKSPEMNLPKHFLNDSIASRMDTVVNIGWWENFNDPQLSELISEALDSNRNILIGYSRLVESQLELRNAKAGLAPIFGLSIDATADYVPRTEIVQNYSIQPTLSWEIDLFGKVRYQTAATRAEMFAEEENLKALKLSIAAEVATSYFSILEYDLSLRISERTLKLRRETAKLIALMLEYGEATLLEQKQNDGLVASAALSVASYRNALKSATMSLCVLLGKQPTDIEIDGLRLLDYRVPRQVPAGLPCDLLERRSDIKEAYYNVQAAYAEVGVAIANRFPSLTLTGEGGLISSTIGTLFSNKPFGWSASAEITQPIFAFGRNKRAVQIAEEKKWQSILEYEENVLTALSEVENALLGIEALRVKIREQEELVADNSVYQQLTSELYELGENDYLTVLDAQREYFSSQLDYASLLSSELQGYVTLYKALGGGF